jgi:hypothetical protein
VLPATAVVSVKVTVPVPALAGAVVMVTNVPPLMLRWMAKPVSFV